MILARLSKHIKDQNWFAVFLEFTIVFISVYLAFLFTEYQNDRERDRHRDRAIEILEYGLDQYDGLFTSIVAYHGRHNPDFEASLSAGIIPNFEAVTFPAPRYSPKAITDLLSREGRDVFEFDIYISMVLYVNALQQLGYVEEKLVTASERYEPLPPEGSPEYEPVRRQQLSLARSYLRYLNIRKNLLERLLTLSAQIRPGLEKAKIKQSAKN